MQRILVADIGATNSRFALSEGDDFSINERCTVSSNTPDFDTILNNVKKQNPNIFAHQADFFVFAVAAPITNQNEVHVTNQKYSIQREQLAPFADNILFINDFAAQAYALATPIMVDAVPIFEGNTQKIPRFTSKYLEDGVNLIGAGTGLGIAYCQSIYDRFYIHPSEAGHSSLVFQSDEEQKYATFLRSVLKRDVIEYEDILSGAGLSRLHAFLTQEQLSPASITSLPYFEKTTTCQWFARFYGRFCRNMALTFLPHGGIVISGGVAGRCPALVLHQVFKDEFLSIRPPFEKFLSSIPIWLNQNQDAGLWGAIQLAKKINLKIDL